MIRWVKKLTLKRKIRREWRGQMGKLTKEERMEVFSSKEQWANMLTFVASVVGGLSSEAIAGWFSATAEGVQTGSLEIVLTSVVTAVISGSRFFSRLNRRREIKAAALEAVRSNVE